MAPFLGDELWALIAVHLAGDVRSLGRLACVSRRFNAKVVPSERGAAPELCSVVDAAARRACADCSEHVAMCAPPLPGQPILRLLWERTLLSRAASLTAVGPGRAAAQRTELSEDGSAAHQPRMPLGEQCQIWASAESEPAFALVPAEANNIHSASCVLLECSQLAVGAVPLRSGQHYVELELLQNSLVPGENTLSAAGASTARFGVVSGPLARSGIAPHALWSPVAQMNPLSRWAQFTDGRGRSYYVREQSDVEIAEHDTAHQIHADDDGHESTDGGPVAVTVDPTFASEDRVLHALSYEAVASLSVPPEGVQVKLKDEDTEDYYFDSIPGQQWMFNTDNGECLCTTAGQESSWAGQRAAKEKDCVGLLLDIGLGTLDVYLNGSRLGTMARGLEGGPFRFFAEIFTDAKVRVTSKPPPLPPSSAAVETVAAGAVAGVGQATA